MPAPRGLDPSEGASEGNSEGGVAYWQSVGGRPLQVQVLRVATLTLILTLTLTLTLTPTHKPYP